MKVCNVLIILFYWKIINFFVYNMLVYVFNVVIFEILMYLLIILEVCKLDIVLYW